MPETERRTPPRLHFLVAPEPSRLLRARDRIRDYLTLHCSDQIIIDDIVLAVEEACTNAIRHSGSPQEIEISLGFEGDDLLAEIKDRGRGFDVGSFDREALPDPRLDHGRGLFLISRLCDEMGLRADGGLEVRLVKNSVSCRDAPSLESGLADISGAPRLVRREARTRALLEEIDEAFAAFDWEYRFVHVNEAMVHLTGKTRDELVGRRSWDIWPAAADTPAARAIREAMELGRPSVVEFRAVASDDWLEARIYPTPAGVSLYAREIGERKRVEEDRELAQQELKRAEERARHLIRHAPAAIFEIDFRGPRFTSVNDFMCEYSGYSREELLATNPAELLAEEDRGLFLERLRTTLADEPTAPSVQYRFTTRQGEERFAILNVSPTLEDGKPVGAFVVGHDVTESKRAAEALRASEERFRSLFESMTEGVALHEVIYEDGRAADYRILDVNSSFEDQTGLSARAARGRLASEIYGAGEAPYLAEYARVAETGESLTFETYFPPMKRHFRITAVAPGPGRFATVFEDITENKRREQERQRLLEESQAMTEELQAQSEELQAQTKELRVELETNRLLLEAAGSLAGSVALADVLDTLSRIVLRLSGHSRVAISSWQEDRGRMEVLLSEGETAVPAGFTILFDDMSAPGQAAITEGTTTLIDYDVLAPGQRGFGDRLTSHLMLHVPLFVQGRLVGFLAADDAGQRREFSQREIRLIEGLAAQAAVALENARLHEAEHEAARLAKTLAELDSLVHSSLEFDEIVQTALREGAAAFGAESCGFSLHDDEARQFRVAYVHNYPPDKIGVLIPDEQDTHGVLAMRSGKTQAIDDTGTDPRVVASLMEAWNIKSVICAPLYVRGRALGVVYYNYHSATHHFSAQEVDFVNRLASSVSTAVENAQLYGAQQRIATTLQENFVHPLPAIAGLELAELSLPAGRDELIGGDFRDVIVRPDGKVVALIGDVTGKGIKAAGFTETVRAAVRTLALISPSPQYILGNVNRLLLHEGEHQQLATALLVVLDPRNGRGRAGQRRPSARHVPLRFRLPHHRAQVRDAARRPGTHLRDHRFHTGPRRVPHPLH